MRISQLSKVTEIPLSTLKDLRHREILELADYDPFTDDFEEKKWGSFSVPTAIVLLTAKRVREAFGLTWEAAIKFAKSALNAVSVPSGGPTSAKFFDLNSVQAEIWVGRFDFPEVQEDARPDWNYFACTFAEIESHKATIDQVAESIIRSADTIAHGAEIHLVAETCILINASRIVADFQELAFEAGVYKR